MAVFKKLQDYNIAPTTQANSYKVTAGLFNTLVDKLNSLFTAEKTIAVDTITEKTSATGVTVDGVLLKDGMVSMATQILAAAGSTIADGGAITGQVIFVTGADATKGVVLPAVADGKIIILVNIANAVLKIYPVSASEKIQGGTGGANISLAAYGVAFFGYKAAGDWYCAEITATTAA